MTNVLFHLIEGKEFLVKNMDKELIEMLKEMKSKGLIHTFEFRDGGSVIIPFSNVVFIEILRKEKKP